jgi:hypothetical protein
VIGEKEYVTNTIIQRPTLKCAGPKKHAGTWI